MKCRKCNIEKPLEMFVKDKRKENGYRNECKICANIRKKKYADKNRDIINKKNREKYKENKEKISLYHKKRYENLPNTVSNIKYKICTLCKKNLKIQEFGKSKVGKYGYRSHCNSCRKLEYQNNKDYVNKKARERYQNNDFNRLIKNIRGLIYQSLKSKNHKKDTKTTEILGCDMTFFNNWLNNEASNDYIMFNDTHIDHVIPISWANTKEEIITLNHYSNLQLLDSTNNLQKGNKYIKLSALKRVLSNHPNKDELKKIIKRYRLR